MLKECEPSFCVRIIRHQFAFLGTLSPVSQRLFGPGVGIRLAKSHCSESSSKFCPTVANEHDQSKLEKFSTILGSPSVDLGLCCVCLMWFTGTLLIIIKNLSE